MDQQIEQQVATKKTTKSAVFTITLMLAALFSVGGFGFAFLLSQQEEESTITPVVTEPDLTPPEAAEVADVLDVSVSSNPEGPSVSGGIVFQGVDTVGTSIQTFGRYEEGIYTDGDISASLIPLAVQVEAGTHPAMIITLKTIDTTTGDTSYKSLFVIPEAYAGVITTADYLTVCIPEKSVSAEHCSNGIFEPELGETGLDCGGADCPACGDGTSYNSLFGIPEAHAGVIDPGNITNYYVDTRGNVYTDPALTNIVNTTDCLTQIAKNFSPNDLYDITSNGIYDLGPESYLVFAKSWDAPLGAFNSADGFIDFFIDQNKHAAPLFVIGGNMSETRTIPQQTLTVQSDLGTKGLCFPTKVLEEEEWFVLFYDINGKPYSDMLLESPIACGSTNTCDSVNCKRLPYHACCVQNVF